MDATNPWIVYHHDCYAEVLDQGELFGRSGMYHTDFVCPSPFYYMYNRLYGEPHSHKHPASI